MAPCFPIDPNKTSHSNMYTIERSNNLIFFEVLTFNMNCMILWIHSITYIKKLAKTLLKFLEILAYFEGTHPLGH